MERFTVEPLRVVDFVQHVRRRPQGYFLVERGSPELPTEVLRAVAWDALHRRDGRHGRISVEIGSGLSFTVESDQRPSADERGFFGSLLDMFDMQRWAPSAAAALSVRTVIEVWLDGCGYRQELVGMDPTGPWEELIAPAPFGTRTTFHLDPAFCGPGEAIAWALRPEELHREGGTCREHPSPTRFPIHDLRAETEGSLSE
ncbi:MULTISPECIES: hypothetical protein [Streptomyces]|uniref:Uncharacterized protein n=1 Tax=Streptomyces venezuelae (strain ATCC 10712 / CBS 650.69 / DSM 40230 / JCM 4526 / NBRC 13096 / PD 04745) TaxID=953739 RepID=F2R339_STRVP|nr:hypothetical protein [Streptomyces venezuelae]APE26020.1 hypothetical protein vnz_36730 [Streptomyces venezuelae]QES03358.1 hypothetical protein DEJ43_37315 [Streptomyces venezuelae ATCC 10712]CCA60738.1 hypothetical protein SVEN_7452 [Streptomyces venezuelae ATCC 10712]